MNYKKGRNFEEYVKYKLQAQGFLVLRIAASKPVDLIAAKRFENGEVKYYAVECKAMHLSDNKIRELAEEVRVKTNNLFLPIIACKRKGKVHLWGV